MLTSEIVEMITTASARALATSGPEGINVVPVSVVRVVDDTIYLYNFFMHKTIANLEVNPEASLVCWSGLAGIQIKATVRYLTGGEEFTLATAEMKDRFPDRILSGVLVLSPQVVYDISADVSRAGVKIAP